eukprot:gene1188-1366_t
MFPNRNKLYTYSGLVAATSAYPAFATTGGDVTSKQEAAAFLANVNRETGGLYYTSEIDKSKTYCVPSAGPCAPGKRYYGRGPLQITWNYHYIAAGKSLGLDLMSNPDLVSTDAAVSWKSALWYWNTQKGGSSHTPHDSIVNQHSFGGTIKAINGGECRVGNKAMMERVKHYKSFCSILGVPTGGSLEC